ncbi:hypothetical protein M2347_003914 [Chryseobacterium sp. H1D6B]|nr:hypothetical protein [Chryseobacterium sp. H1D6B]
MIKQKQEFPVSVFLKKLQSIISELVNNAVAE